jgi:hypothetical protein
MQDFRHGVSKPKNANRGAENRVVLLTRKHLRINGFSPGRSIAERWDYSDAESLAPFRFPPFPIFRVKRPALALRRFGHAARRAKNFSPGVLPKVWSGMYMAKSSTSNRPVVCT